MEKTNSNIPTPEELKAYIDESVISVTGTYEQSASVLMVDDSIIGTLENFSIFIAVVCLLTEFLHLMHL
ncbi:hypothetical protein LG35_09665 [Alistipes inops]|uniref:Uncharacterized protein n=1 Tax=Alistipes inops TaxID=1501391 RepID=A0ABR4YGX7_9BACT|nr:hypothetical protein LG35_09665 [Alistipes inops]